MLKGSGKKQNSGSFITKHSDHSCHSHGQESFDCSKECT